MQEGWSSSTAHRTKNWPSEPRIGTAIQFESIDRRHRRFRFLGRRHTISAPTMAKEIAKIGVRPK